MAVSSTIAITVFLFFAVLITVLFVWIVIYETDKLDREIEEIRGQAFGKRYMEVKKWIEDLESGKFDR